MTRRFSTILAVLLVSLSLTTTSFAAKKGKIIDTARSAPISLTEAIEKAEDRLSGDVFEIELTRKKKRDVYNMWVAVNNGVYELSIDAEDGKTIQQTLKNKKPLRLGRSINEVIQIALKKQPGIAFSAVCKKKRARCTIEVATASDDIYEVVVDGNTGDIQSIELK